MLSIGRLNGPRWSAEYYIARQAGCPADYYTGSGERRGVWIGSGAHALGLTGEIDEAQFRALLAGRSPDGAAQWMAPVWRVDPRGKLPVQPLVAAAANVAVDSDDSRVSETLERARRLADRALRSVHAHATIRADRAGLACAALGLDPRAVFGPAYNAALAHIDERVDVRLPGLDLTFSAPKSVSVLYGLAPDTTSEQVRLGHEAAVAQALGYLERVAGHALRGHQGDGVSATRVRTQGFVAAAFGHRSNRCGDPQLHTHVVVANMVLDEHGRASALDSRELYRQARTAGFLYQAALRAELTRRLGVAWGPVTRGHAEIAGVPDKLRTVFSKRRKQIEEVLAELHEQSPRAAQHATLATRPAKETGAPAQPLRERWADEAREAGVAPESLSACLGRASSDDARCPAVDEAASTLLTPSGLTRRIVDVRPSRRSASTRRTRRERRGRRGPRVACRATRDRARASCRWRRPGPDRRYSTAELLTRRAAWSRRRGGTSRVPRSSTRGGRSGVGQSAGPGGGPARRRPACAGLAVRCRGRDRTRRVREDDHAGRRQVRVGRRRCAGDWRGRRGQCGPASGGRDGHQVHVPDEAARGRGVARPGHRPAMRPSPRRSCRARRSSHGRNSGVRQPPRARCRRPARKSSRSAIRINSPPSRPAACSPRSRTGSAPSSSPRTCVRMSGGNTARWRICGPATSSAACSPTSTTTASTQPTPRPSSCAASSTTGASCRQPATA